MAVDITKPAKAAAPKGVINLEKKGSTLSLDKKTGFDKIVINLNWNQGTQQKKTGFFAGLLGGVKSGGIDLDVGCLFELKTGEKGAVQALGNAFGDYRNAPYIQLMGDDRTGDSTEGEFIHINGAHFDKIKRVLVYAFIYEGVANWTETDAVITMATPGHDTIRVAMDGNANKSMVAIAMIENDRDNLKVTKLVEFFDGHRLMDERYNWGMRWTAGSK